MKLFVLFALAFSSLADSTSYHSDPYNNVPVYKKEENGYHGGHHYSKLDEYRTYNYNYDVKDADSSVDYGKQETSDGKGSVSGNYHVMLPDGRKQSVTYKADENGYVADIQYEGEAHTPYSTDTYSTHENKGYEHQPHYYPKGNKHSGTSYKGHDNYQIPYVKEHAATSPKYHANNPNPHKYPQTHSTSYPYGKSGTHHPVPYTKEHTDKYPVNYPTVYPKDQDNYQTPYTSKGSHNYGTPNHYYPEKYSTTYSNGNHQVSKGHTHPNHKYPENNPPYHLH